MKSVFKHISVYLLSLLIVAAYSGVSVFKMICAAENGKVMVSLTNIKDECNHEAPKQLQSAEEDCCRKNKKPEKVKNTSSNNCCDYAYLHLKLDDETLVQKPLQQAGHILPQLRFSFEVLPSNLPELHATLIQTNPPPLLHLRKQTYLSFINTYLI
ncbi:MAG: hypothetical protein ACK5UI_11040 [Bacteroidota bacterium]